MSEEKKIYIPYLKWYQTNSNININIQLGNTIDSKIIINNNYFLFSGNVQDKYYEINFELFDKLKENTLSYYISEKDIKITIEKESEEKWTSLTKIKNLYKNNIQINWNLWIDSDDEDNGEENNMPFDMQQMMANMGGGGNNMPFDMEQMQNMMANMGGMENMFGNAEDAEGSSDAEESSDAEDNIFKDIEYTEDPDLENQINNVLNNDDNNNESFCELCE